MSLLQYLSPINPDHLGYDLVDLPVTLSSQIDAHIDHLPEIPQHGLVLVGVGEDRGAEQNAGCAAAPDEIRRYLYRLALPCPNVTITDIGNIILGQTAEDTYYALAEVVAQVLQNNNTLIILGGSQDLTFAAYKGYERLNRIINITSIDSRFDLMDDDQISSHTWLRNIVMQNPNYLFFHSNIGYQTYFVGQDYVKLMDDMKFDAYRLGNIQPDMQRAEALIRNSNLLTVDIGAVRQSDAPANGNPSPHGFYGEELCQMMRFAGRSDNTTCLGIFEVNPLYDNHGQTAHLVAHALWYFIEGYFDRQRDNPLLTPECCKHYHVVSQNNDETLDFYKSKLSDRWWVRVPCNNPELNELYSNQLMLPCTYADYKKAMQGEIPSLYLKYYTRLNQ